MGKNSARNSQRFRHTERIIGTKVDGKRQSKQWDQKTGLNKGGLGLVMCVSSQFDADQRSSLLPIPAIYGRVSGA